MNSNSTNNKKKYKKPKQKTQKTTNPGTSKSKHFSQHNLDRAEPVVPLQAKDSEWVDVLAAPKPVEIRPSTIISDEEELLQLVDCEDDIQLKPLVLMFPGLLERDPQTLQGILDRVLSTTEVTKQLVNLGQKADFTYMKNSNRLIPPDKKWLESVAEDTGSISSLLSDEFLMNDSDGDNSMGVSSKHVSNNLFFNESRSTIHKNIRKGLEAHKIEEEHKNERSI